MSIAGTRSDRKPQRRANQQLGIAPYSGTWDRKAAAHLLRRVAFSPARADVLTAESKGLDAALAGLLEDLPAPAAPIDPTTGKAWIASPFDSTNDSRFQGYLSAWWMGLMVTSGISLREKMVLFWHNHFACEYDTVLDSRCMYLQNALFRRYALGNIKELVKAVTVDPAMLVYLNGYRNRGDGTNIPDENYARELQELFTIGKGPQIAPGDYTNYTEQDVKAAARVLTGWRITGYRDTQNAAITSYFDAARHDARDKEFSHEYQNSRIVGGVDGQRELNDLVEMIFRQPETARYLCRKLYRWFVYYGIDETVEDQVIEPLALLMRQSNYEIKPVLDALLRSSHFYDENNMGCMIKCPADFVAGAFRVMEIPPPSPATQTSVYYSLMASLRGTSATLQMNLMDLPNVAGWPAYYQTPDFYRLWINTVTLPVRWSYTDSLINGIRVGGSTFVADPLAYAKGVSVPGEPYVLVREISSSLFPLSLTSTQVEYLVREVLVPGVPDYEWGLIWNTYTSDPNNAQKRNAVVSRLNSLLKFMLRMAEFELA